MLKKNRFLSIFVALLPSLITILVLGGIFRVNIADFRPRIWHDQGGYWHWARSFSYYGFDVGYNGFNETVAPAAFNHYAENGPFYQMIYGGIGQIFGWQNALPVYINMALLAMAVLFFLQVTKLSRKGILHTAALLVFLFPILLYLPSNMHESMNQAIAIVLAGVFFLLYSGEEISPAQKIFFSLFLFLASLIRLSWAILLPPFFFMLFEGKFLKKFSLALLFSAFLGYAALKISGYLLPPAGNIIFELLQAARVEGWHVFLHHLREQLTALLTREKNRMDLVVTAQALLLAGFPFAYLLAQLKKKENPLEKLPLFHLYNLLAPVGMGLFFYLVNGYHRIFMPHIIVSALLLVSQKKYIPLYALVTVGFVGISPFLANYRSMPANFQPDSETFLATRAQLEEYLSFDENAENAWCNTLLLPAEDYYNYVTMMPAGFGVAPITAPEMLQYPLKSKYLLLSEAALARGAYIKHFPFEDLGLELLDSLPQTDLYYNPASGCPLH